MEKKQLQHNGVQSFLLREKQAFTNGLYCSIAVPVQVPQGRDHACLCHHSVTANCLQRGHHLNLKQWGCVCITHCWSKHLLHQAVLQKGEGEMKSFCNKKVIYLFIFANISSSEKEEHCMQRSKALSWIFPAQICASS